MTITNNKRRKGNTKSTIFGVAMSSLFVSSEIQADVLDFTMDGGNQSAFVELGDVSEVNFDQLFGPEELIVSHDIFTIFISQGNYTYFSWRTLGVGGYLTGIEQRMPGAALDPDTFVGVEDLLFGNMFVGFRTRENNTGWFQVDLNSSGVDIIAGELATAGETLTVGGTPTTLLGDANCDGVVSLLDVSTFVDQISSNTFSDKSDMNADGVVNLLDVGPFTALLNGAGTAIMNNNELRVRTTTSDDDITVSQVADSIRVTVNGTQLGDFASVSRIVIEARQGNDTISVQPDVNQATWIYAGSGNDIIFGGSGDDNIFGAQGDDQIFGRDGNDYIVGAAGTNEIFGQNGDDTIFGGQFGIISGGDGDDTITGNDWADEICGNAGNDIVFAGRGNDIVHGGPGNDEIDGGQDDDILMGDGGADIISGGRGADMIFGGAQNDNLNGDDDDDMIFGGDGDDLIQGDDGADILSGDDGDDRLYGRRTNSDFDFCVNQLFGGSGNDVLSAARGGDMLFGESGNDELLGNFGADMLNGGPQDDLLLGGDGNDDVFGAGGDDVLAGELGNDFLNGGADIDTALDFGETGHINIEIDPP